jgi:hypothetical protein
VNPLRSRKALIAIAAVIAVAGSSLGLYLHLRPQASPRPASPTVVSVGAQTVAKAATAEYLSVVRTSPGSGSIGAPVNTSISFDFNLSVDPAAVQSYFSVLPTTQGSFAQGITASQVVFTPSTNFAAGSSVNVALRSGLTSRDGFALQDSYSLSFQTVVSAQSVVFQAANQVATLVNAQSGRSVNVTVQLGDQVPADIALQTYRSNVSDLLTALVHSSSGQYINNAIDTTLMQLVDTKGPVRNGDTITVAQADGIYLLLATDAAGQYGAMWVDFSKYGVLVRQDDQRIVVAGENLSTGDTTPLFKITFYNLQDSVKVVMSGGFSGSQDFSARYPSGIDVAVATSPDGEQLLVPISAPASDADLKVVGDLAQQPEIYLTTDRAAYQKGDTVKFAGVVRISNDQAYSISPGMNVAVWAGQLLLPSRLVNQTASVGADGTFSGSFAIPDGAFNQDGTDAQLTLYTDVATHPTDFSTFFTVIGALGPHAPAGKLTVGLDKTAYVLNDTIVASISGTDINGKPLANQALSLTVYSTQYQVQPHETDSFPSPSTWGVPVQQNVKVQFDATGHATYSFSANVAQKAADQQLTVGVTYGSGASAVVGARTAVVYQAADEVFLLASRSVYQPGDQVSAPFVVETRAGDRVANTPVAYEFDSTDYQGSNAITTVVASGSVSTDGNGLGVVRTTYSGSAGAVLLRVKGKDAAGNTFVDTKSLTITNDPTSLVSFSDTLLELGVTTDKIAYGVGDSAHLTITSPAPQEVFLTLERGRIHQYKWVTLAQGDNRIDLAISPDLAPGFTLMFSYFRNGAYITEGLPVSVNNSSQLLKVTVTADQAGYAPGKTAQLTVAVTDSAGAPVAATLLVDGYDASMSSYKLVDQRSVARLFQTPAPRGTNASSSLLGIGNWGGRCGGGGNPEQPATTNPGQLAVWLTDLTTDGSGHATIDVPIAQSAVRVSLIAATSASAWGQVETDLSVQ